MFYFLFFLSLTVSIYGRSTNVDTFEDEKIVGGDVVNVEDYPYQVSLLIDGGLWCGGSIISNLNVLTAAHCVIYAKKPLVVHAGSSYWKNGGSYHDVVDTYVYGNEVNTDLAVLLIEQPFVFDATRQPIELPLANQVPSAGAMATVSGWGGTNHATTSRQLKATQVPIVDRQVCDDLYKKKQIAEIVEGQLCAGFVKTGGQDACQGDSGGPLVIDDVQYGIVSMGEGCAEPNAPGIYCDVSFFIDWINSKITT